jgi:hypothetical protein
MEPDPEKLDPLSRIVRSPQFKLVSFLVTLLGLVADALLAWR